MDRKQSEGCALCLEASREDGPENLIVYRAEFSFVILNRYPYTSGHIMVVPYVHRDNLTELDSSVRSEMMELSTTALQVLAAEYQAPGFNIGINIGEAGGAGIHEHIHLHVVPRWNGDTNFMTSLSRTRVLPESLEESYWRIKNSWDHLKKIPAP